MSNGWVPHDSSMIAGSKYDPDKKELQIKFKNGATYAYEGVLQEDHDDLISATSVGTFFHDNIKDKYSGRRV